MHVVYVYMCSVCVWYVCVWKWCAKICLRKTRRAVVNFFYSSPTLECQNVVGCFILLGGPSPSSQINHTRCLIVIYKSPALAWFVSCQLFLNYPQLPFASGLFPFLLYILLSLLTLWLAGWLDPDVLPPLLVLSCSFFLSSQIPPTYSLRLPAPPILSPASLLAVQRFISPSGILDKESQLHRVKQT
ncbi:hypothetical protein ACRRTK_008347 [Alexandromys fortis]